MKVTPQQFREYQQQWTQPAENGGAGDNQQKQNAGYWVAFCYQTPCGAGNGGVCQNKEEAARILEQVIQEQDAITNSNIHDNTGKHRYLLAKMQRSIDFSGQRTNQLYQQALPRLEVEAQRGNDENSRQSAWHLGTYFFQNRGADGDWQRGIHWLKVAAELGHDGARTRLALCCSKEPNASSLFSWWKQMADQHECAWAQWCLGLCYNMGRGVEKDLVKAVEWYNKAIVQGHYFSIAQKNRLLRSLSLQERNKTLGCVERNQKIGKANDLVQANNVPLGLWAHALGFFQNQAHPLWEAPSPTFLALCDGVVPQIT